MNDSPCSAPVLEFDAQFAGPLRGAHDLELVEPERAKEIANRGHGGFADPHRADLRRIDHRDLEAVLREVVGKAGGRHPARGATSDDDEFPDAVVSHWNCANRKPPRVVLSTRGGQRIGLGVPISALRHQSAHVRRAAIYVRRCSGSRIRCATGSSSSRTHW